MDLGNYLQRGFLVEVGIHQAFTIFLLTRRARAIGKVQAWCVPSGNDFFLALLFIMHDSLQGNMSLRERFF